MLTSRTFLFVRQLLIDGHLVQTLMPSEAPADLLHMHLEILVCDVQQKR